MFPVHLVSLGICTRYICLDLSNPVLYSPRRFRYRYSVFLTSEMRLDSLQGNILYGSNWSFRSFHLCLPVLGDLLLRWHLSLLLDRGYPVHPGDLAIPVSLGGLVHLVVPEDLSRPEDLVRPEGPVRQYPLSPPVGLVLLSLLFLPAGPALPLLHQIHR